MVLLRRNRIFRAGPLVAVMALAACVGAPEVRRSVPVKRPVAQKPAPAPAPRFAADVSTRQCMADLGAASVQYSALPDRQFDGGCSTLGGVKLLDIGTPVTNLGAMTCPLAKNFAAWARYGVRPAARQILGAEVVKIETMGTYNCRTINGNGGATGRLSEHAHSNAVDVAAFVLDDGRRIAVRGGWKEGTSSERAFLKTIHNSACKRFATVLSPDYNAAHYDHFHLDMGRGPFCR
jgi:hypothetical protein